MIESADAIKVRNISKSYIKYRTNMQKIQHLLFNREAGTRIEVLHDVSFDIKKGEKVGIIGRQQSGKSTLMRVLAGIIRPDSGSVQLIGSTTEILDIRLGFDNAMTGRDNYMIMSTALGWDENAIEMHEASVFEFAGLTEEIDEPIRTYKKGCAARLGFATATEIRDDIILFDASLAFGSKSWNRACMNRMKEFISGDTTFVMVVNKISDAAKLCDRGIVIHEGMLVYDGAYTDAIEYFRKNCRQISRKAELEALEEPSADEMAEDMSSDDDSGDDDDV